ncbi:MAG: hypothetical protein AB7R40_23380 [Nitrospiraceae bacterium]
MIRPTAFAADKLPPAPAQYDRANEQKFRALVTTAFSKVMVATNDVTSDLPGMSLFGWSHNLVFSATDNDTVAWTSGSIYLRDGTTYSISAGNTGNITTVTYIFLDLAVSATVLQTTTTASSAVGPNRILVAVANDVASGKDAQFQVMGGADDGELVLITADVIAANTITANEIAANTITAAQIAAGTITATEIAANTITGANIASLNISTKTLTADTGTIGGWGLTASTLFSDAFTLASGNYPSITLGSATAFGAGTGVFIGRDIADDLYKLRIGHPTASPQFAYNGTAIALNGAVVQAPAAGSSPALLGWSHDLVFSATDNDTVAWSSGTITLQNGVTYAISAGNTGNMSAPTYIFLDQDVSTTVLQTGTSVSGAVGHGRILIAVANDVASGKDAMFQVFGGADPQKIELIVADIIAANTITANEIAANTITASQIAAGTITVTELSAGTLSASNIEAGTLTASVIIASDSFTAANPVFQGEMVIEAGEGADRFAFSALAGVATLFMYDSNDDPALEISALTGALVINAPAGHNLTLSAADRDITLEAGSGDYIELRGLPTSNPGGSNRVWRDSGTLKIT